MTYELRKSRAEDAESVADVLKYAEFLLPQYRTGENLPLIRSRCDQGAFLVAEEWGGRIMSVVMIIKEQSEHHTHFTLPILVTLPEYERRGLARRLLRKIIEEADALGASISAHPENKKSVGLLESEGFSLDPANKDRQGNPRYVRLGLANR